MPRNFLEIFGIGAYAEVSHLSVGVPQYVYWNFKTWNLLKFISLSIYYPFHCVILFFLFQYKARWHMFGVGHLVEFLIRKKIYLNNDSVTESLLI